MLTRKQVAWLRRVVVIAAIVVPSLLIGHGAHAARYDLCIPKEDISLLDIKIKRLCVPVDLP